MSTMIKMVRALTAAAAIAVAAPAFAAGDGPHIERQQWSFAGPFGTFERGQLQRGFKVYQEVCAACHGLRQVAFRNLAEEGGPSFSEEQAKVIAAEYTVVDGPNDDGDMYDRPG
ncbi:MAG: cytochrome c1, partial [Roseibium sp.]|uniref:cytochrome c1 n=1 Tax=Roseibium sp. TaxID=1936156 RepID=UPI003263439C